MKTVLEFTRERLIKELEKKEIRKNVKNNFVGSIYHIISQNELIYRIRENKEFTENLIENNIQELQEFYSCFFQRSYSENEMYFLNDNKNNHDRILQHFILEIAKVLFNECLEKLGVINNYYIWKEFPEDEKEQILLNVLEMLKNDKSKVLNLEDEL